MKKYVPEEGDYVVHSELTLEEYTEFHNTVINAGFESYIGRSADNRYKAIFPITGLGADCLQGFGAESDIVHGGNNVTHYFKKVSTVEFTKKDLRNTMLVEYRNKDLRMVWNDTLVDSDLQAKNPLGNYSNSLLDTEGLKGLDIMAIYEHKGATPTDFVKGELVWERTEQKPPVKKSVTLELTDEQLEKIKAVLGD